ncbi:MAG: hypothetical protein K2M69_00145 [Muribaculaceae bacterium]|nr:hypothetical protein [Muribaculaceae bacterium]
MRSTSRKIATGCWRGKSITAFGIDEVWRLYDNSWREQRLMERGMADLGGMGELDPS